MSWEKKNTKERFRKHLREKMKNVDIKMWVLVAVLWLGLAEAGRELHPIFDSSGREELVNLAGYGEEKISTVLITGSVLCRDHEADAHSQPVSGVKVRVRCTMGKEGTRKSSFEETLTDEFGDFTLDLPSHLHGTQNLDKACQVKVLQGHRRKERFASRHHTSMIKLASASNGVRTYTTGKIHLLSLKPRARPSIASALIRLAKLPIAKRQG